MEEDFIPQDRALRLKNLGFDEPCLRGWDIDGVVWYHPDSEVILDNPTFSQAFRWFRDNYKQHCHPMQRYSDIKVEYDFILNGKWANRNYERYEEAELACLDKLLEIAESL